MRKLFLVPLAIACTFVAANASATKVKTITLFDPAVPETPESIQVDRHGNIYVSLARTGEVRTIAPDGTQSTLALLPLHPEIQPCQNVEGRRGNISGIALDHQGNVYVAVNSCNTADVGIWKITPCGQAVLNRSTPGGSRGALSTPFSSPGALSSNVAALALVPPGSSPQHGLPLLGRVQLAKP